MTIIGLCVWVGQAMSPTWRGHAGHRTTGYELLPSTDLPVEEALPVSDYPDVRRTSELLVDSIVQIESCGDFLCVGKAGERGLMQIKPSTWKDVTFHLYGKSLPFDWAFDPDLNRKVGKAYLSELHELLIQNKALWRSDERSLLLAAYNGGPHRLIQSRFDLKRMPASTRDYVERVTAMHEYYLADHALEIRRLLASAKGGPQGS